MKRYGSDKTNLVLTERAARIYTGTDPLVIYECDDGTYLITGAIGTYAGLADFEVSEILEGCSTWYAVQETRDDDWSYGSYYKDEAIRMLAKQGHGLIAIINAATDRCEGEIPYELAFLGGE